MADELPGLTSKVTVDPSGVAKGLDVAIGKIQKFSGDGARHVEAFKKRVDRAFQEISGNKAADRLNVLENALRKAGGAGAIAAPQLHKLGEELDKIAGAGGKVPGALQPILTSFQSMKAASAEAERALKGTQEQAAKLKGAGLSLAQGGGITGALQSIGPAGIVAAGGLAAATAATAKLAKEVVELIKRGSEVANVERSFERLSAAAGQNAQAVVAAGRLGSAGLVSDFELMANANKGLLLGLPITAQEMETLSRASVTLGQAMRVGPEEALGDLITGLGRGSAAILDNLGITLNSEEAHKKYADSLGKTTEELTDGEKKMAVYTAAMTAMKANTEALGGINVGAAESVQQLKVQWENLTDSFGKTLSQNPELVGALRDTASAVAAIGDAVAKHRGAIGAFLSGLVGGQLKGLGTLARSARDLVASATGQVGTGSFVKPETVDFQAKPLVGPGVKLPASASEKAEREAIEKDIADTRKRFSDQARRDQEADIRAMSSAMKASAEDSKDFIEQQEKLAADFGKQVLADLLDDQKAMAAVIKESGKDSADLLADAERRASEHGQQVLRDFKKRQDDARRSLENLARSFQDVGTIIDQVGGLFDALGVSADSGLGRAIAGVQGLANAAAQGGEAAARFASGDVLGGIQAGIGAVTSAISGVKTLFGKPEHERVMEDIGRDLGVNISEGLAKQIAEDSKQLGDRVAATLKNLGGIIDDAGGVKAFGTDKAIASTRDLFSALERGSLTAKDVGETFEDVFGKILPEATDRATGLVSQDFKGLISLAKQFGIESKGVSDFLNSQATAAGSSLADAIKGGVETEGGAAGFGAAISAQLEEMVKRGASRAEALASLQPAITSLREELERTGFAGGAAFDVIAAQARILSDEVTGPLVGKIDASANALVALQNQGLLTGDIFAGITGEIGATSDKLKQQGVEGPAALAVMQPALQKVFELQQATGFAVDATTQALLDEAVAAGVVGDAHKSAQDRMVDASERVAVAVETLVKGLGFDLPEAAARGAAGVQSALDGIRAPSFGIPIRFEGGVLPDLGGSIPAGGSFAKGGARDFGRVSFASLHGREAVLPAGGGDIVDQLARSIVASGGLATAGVGGGDVVTNVTVAVDPLGAPRNLQEFLTLVDEHVGTGIRTGRGKTMRALQDRGKVK